MGRAEPKMNGLDRPGQNVQKRVYYFYFDEILIDSMIAIVTSKNFHIYSLLATKLLRDTKLKCHISSKV